MRDQSCDIESSKLIELREQILVSLVKYLKTQEKQMPISWKIDT